MPQAQNSNDELIKVLLFLSTPKMKDNYIGRDDLFDLLKIPEDLKGEVFNKLWNGPVQFIDGKPAIKNPPIKINNKGMEYAEKLKDDIFLSNCTNLDLETKKIPLSETFEIIFKKHKEKGGSLTWHKQAFEAPLPENLHNAKEMMLNKKILFQHSKNSRITLLNSEIIECISYEEAVKALSESNSLKNNSSTITIGGNFNGNLKYQSSESIQYQLSNDQNQLQKQKNKNWVKIIGVIGSIVAGILTILKALKIL